MQTLTLETLAAEFDLDVGTLLERFVEDLEHVERSLDSVVSVWEMSMDRAFSADWSLPERKLLLLEASRAGLVHLHFHDFPHSPELTDFARSQMVVTEDGTHYHMAAFVR